MRRKIRGCRNKIMRIASCIVGISAITVFFPGNMHITGHAAASDRPERTTDETSIPGGPIPPVQKSHDELVSLLRDIDALSDIAEKQVAYDAFVVEYAETADHAAQSLVLLAYLRIAELHTSREEKRRIYDHILNTPAWLTEENIEHVNETFEGRFFAGDNPKDDLHILDDWYAFALRMGDTYCQAYAMLTKANFSESAAEKIEAYDIVINTPVTLEDEDENGETRHLEMGFDILAMSGKAALLRNPIKKMQLYTSIIEKVDSDSLQFYIDFDNILIEAMQGKAQCVDDRAEKIKIYQSIWSRFRNDTNLLVEISLKSSMQELLNLLENPIEKRDLSKQLQERFPDMILPDIVVGEPLAKAAVDSLCSKAESVRKERNELFRVRLFEPERRYESALEPLPSIGSVKVVP